MVNPMARAGVAVGADGLIIEFIPIQNRRFATARKP
jgi:3-deoxy-D-arabino-heptulosonate 7-phosphate (DAHP) synthase